MERESRRPAEATAFSIHRHDDTESLTPDPPAAKGDPLDAVSVFAPWCGETERGLRIRIHRARDSATARATRCKHAGARSIYWLAAQIAAARVFARMPNEDLKETIDNLARLFVVAGWIERTEAPDAE